VPGSSARVSTTAASRYGKQLAEHLSRHSTPQWDGTDGLIVMPFGTCALRAEVDALVLRAEAADEAALSRVEEVAGSHLERFGRRNELSVTWIRDSEADHTDV
jgi:hypothetical protein